MAKTNLDEFLDSVCNDIKYVPIRNEVRNELYDHILEDKETYIKNGLNEVHAEKQALKNMGNPSTISKQFNHVYKKNVDIKSLLILTSLIFLNIVLLLTVFFKSNQNSNFLSTNIFYLCIGVVLSIGIYFIDYSKLKKYYIVIGVVGLILNLFSNSIFVDITLISTVMYIVVFSTILEKNNLPLTIIFFILSLGLLNITTDSSSNRMIFYLTLITYVILIYSKLNFTCSKKNKLIFISIVLTMTILTFLYTYFYSSFRIERLFETTWQNEVISTRLHKTKFLGNSNLDNNFTIENSFSIIYLIETYGKFLGILIILLFIGLYLHTLRNLNYLKDTYAKMLTIGIISFLVLQCLFNLFGILGILNVGMISLPFISYNDIGIIVNIISIALLLSIYSRKNLIIYR